MLPRADTPPVSTRTGCGTIGAARRSRTHGFCLGRRPHYLLAHLLPPLWLFGGALAQDRVPYFRDISTYYFPNWVFLARSLKQGVWPLWNPTADGGAPFLLTYPLDLLLVLGGAAPAPPPIRPPLHPFLPIPRPPSPSLQLGAPT